MASDFLAVLPLDVAKRNLLIPAADTSQDAFITECIEDAVNLMQQKVDDPVLDRDFTFRFDPRESNEPFCFRQRWVKAAGDIAYWLPSQNAAAPPGGSITASTLRLVTERDGFNRLYPPSPDYTWPERAAGTIFRVVVSVGLDPTTDAGRVVRRAAILATRAFYDGDANIRPDNAIDAVLAPVSAAQQ